MPRTLKNKPVWSASTHKLCLSQILHYNSHQPWQIAGKWDLQSQQCWKRQLLLVRRRILLCPDNLLCPKSWIPRNTANPSFRNPPYNLLLFFIPFTYFSPITFLFEFVMRISSLSSAKYCFSKGSKAKILPFRTIHMYSFVIKFPRHKCPGNGLCIIGYPDTIH